MRRMINIPLIIVFASLASKSYALEIKRDYRSSRYLGMGDAGVSLAQGYDALFYNPAGMADIKGILNEIAVISPQVEIGADSKQIYNDISKSGTNDALALVNKIVNKPLHIGIQNFSGVAFKRAAFGIIENSQVNALVGTNPFNGLPQASVDATVRFGSYIGFARSFYKDSLFLGGNLKFMQKAECQLDVSATQAESMLKDKSFNTFLKDHYKRGNGIGGDVGMIWQMGGKVKPRLGVNVKNVGGLHYSWAIPASGNKPSTDLQSIDVGLSVQPETKKSKSILSIDIHDAANANKQIIYKRIHMGGELSFMDIFGVKGGFNQGYPTYGAFLNFKIIKIEGGIYSEELGDLPGDVRSKRIYGKISIGWNR